MKTNFYEENVKKADSDKFGGMEAMMKAMMSKKKNILKRDEFCFGCRGSRTYLEECGQL